MDTIRKCLGRLRRGLSFAIVLLCVNVWPTATGAASEVLDLAGTWNVRLDPKDEGVNQGWASQTLAGSVRLPGTTDEAGLGEEVKTAETGVLTRRFKFYGPVWYQREIRIPSAWTNRQVELFLERVMWESRVWVDGRLVGSADSLGTPHVFSLGRLAAGRHELTLRVDNRPIHPIGTIGHAYTEQTQTIWNGVVGRLELRAHDALRVGWVRAFPHPVADKIDLEVEVLNADDTPRSDLVYLDLVDPNGGGTWRLGELPCDALDRRVVLRSTLKLPVGVKRWSEFEPAWYRLRLTVGTKPTGDPRELTVGFRAVSRVGQQLAVDGRPVFLRGNLDCVHFPLTGYPAMTVEGWKRLFRVYQAYGLNHVRFHTWTPPEAAFQAADELGIYIQAEIVWTQRRLGRDQAGPLDAMDFGSFPKDLLHPPGTMDNYVRTEMRRVVDTYGNHPSFLLLTIGNELGSFDAEVCGRWIAEEKIHDPRHFYAVSTARRIVPQDDYSVTHEIPGVGACRDRVEPRNDWDYEERYRPAPVPIIAHEVGQWPTYPVWREIDKYRGVLHARNLERFRDLAEAHGLTERDAEFRQASGALALRLYKDQIESHLRTPSCSGFQLLSMQDFSGQGEALVGWLDSFYDTKGLVTPQRFRRWCDSTVPLARLPKYVYTAGEALTASLEVAHYGAADLIVSPRWRLLTPSGQTLAGGALAPATLRRGQVSPLGSMQTALPTKTAPSRLRLEVWLEGTAFANDWDVWVFPTGATAAPPASVCVTASLDEALEQLGQGRRVLLQAHRLGTAENARLARFKPVYWSAWMFRGQRTLGAYVENQHPALAQFPTDKWLDWQWQDLCAEARGFVLDDLPLDYRAIVQPIDDFHFNHKLGSLFELATPEGGRLLVCGYNLTDRLDQRPAARQLRASLLAYAQSEPFAPRTVVSAEVLRKLFPVVKEAPRAAGPAPEKCLLFVQAGAAHADAGNAPWAPVLDVVKTAAPGWSYRVQCNAVWRDESGTAWWGSPSLRVRVQVPAPGQYDCYVHFHDWNENGRAGTVEFEGRSFALGEHAGPGRWVKFEARPEDCADGQLVLEARPTAGPNLQITALAVLPRQP